MEMSEKPKVVVKVKNMPLILDYCVENKLKFSASPRLTPDEWEFELGISDIMGAVALGMFLRENRIEMVGLPLTSAKTQAAKSAKVSKAPSKKSEPMIDLTHPELETPSIEVQAENEFVEEVVTETAPLAVEEPMALIPEPATIEEPAQNEFNMFASSADDFSTDNGSQTNDLLFG